VVAKGGGSGEAGGVVDMVDPRDVVSVRPGRVSRRARRRCHDVDRSGDAMVGWILGVPVWTGVIVGVIVTLLLTVIF
jgi:hypothetical protein